MDFYLGAHHPAWLNTAEVPLFVSHRTLGKLKRKLPIAKTRWALDSGGFSELSMFGEWRTTTKQYIAAVRRYVAEVGNLEWCAPQDWMCEPFIIKKTGLNEFEHQLKTVINYLTLREAAPELPFIPVLQASSLPGYARCWDMYESLGVDITKEPRIGLGSVCRRQGTRDIAEIVTMLASGGLKLHGFGVKTNGLKIYADSLVSADSLAWSYRGRRVAGCSDTHKNEANCRRFAIEWRSKLAGVGV